MASDRATHDESNVSREVSASRPRKAQGDTPERPGRRREDVSEGKEENGGGTLPVSEKSSNDGQA